MDNLILYESPYPKLRIGKNNDGGYVISNLPGEYDLFISGGISNDISFEENFLNIFPNLKCIAFDGTINYLPKKNNNIDFIKKNLGDTNSFDTSNLDEYICVNKNIFMKIDIEGHEFKLLPSIIKSDKMINIKQLIIEIHSPADIDKFPNYFKGLSFVDNNLMFNMFSEINKTHTLVHLHANNGCLMQQINGINLPHVFELTYIRNDFVTTKILNTESLPTKLDMPNIISKPDYELNGFPYTSYDIIQTNQMYCSCLLIGRLGNYLFQIISSWVYARKNNLEFVIDDNFKINKYYNLFFSNITTTNIKKIKFDVVMKFDIFENCLNHEYDIKSNVLLSGFLQNANNFDIYRNDVLETFFNIKSLLEPNNNFFIHIRLTDFLTSNIHNINLDNYYENAIQYAQNIIDFSNSNIYIVSDDIQNAKKKSYLNLLPQNNLIFINNTDYDEIKTFDLFKNCYLGCICGNSTFAWWGAYIINNPSKLVIIPNKFLNTNDDFSGMYLNYTVMEV